MDRDQLIDLTRRALKLARDKTTDLAPSEYAVRADAYTSVERLARDKAMLIASPQLVGYASELPKPGSYCTKTVDGDGPLHPDDPGFGRVGEGVRQRVPAPADASRGGLWHRAPIRLPVSRVDVRPRRQPWSGYRARKDSPKHARLQRD